MTPKEKAQELISLFDTNQYFDENKNVIYTFDHFTIDDKKRCVKMFIDEILFVVDCTSPLYDFYLQVKEEIETI